MPALRSRGAITHEARKLAETREFRAEMTRLFESEPAGRLTIPTLQDALDRLAACEELLEGLAARVGRLERKP